MLIVGQLNVSEPNHLTVTFDGDLLHASICIFTCLLLVYSMYLSHFL